MSLSWGFSRDHPGIEAIEKALIDAHKNNIVILAAASNEGDLNKVAFPARLYDYVICIGATEGFGAVATFTTTDPDLQSYATLGKAVSGASLKGLWYKSNPTELRSGTSTATPIAAGIAALLIDYAHRNDLKLEKSHKSMLNLFATISYDKDTYRFLAPSQLIENPDALKKIIEDGLANGISQIRTFITNALEHIDDRRPHARKIAELQSNEKGLDPLSPALLLYLFSNRKIKTNMKLSSGYLLEASVIATTR